MNNLIFLGSLFLVAVTATGMLPYFLKGVFFTATAPKEKIQIEITGKKKETLAELAKRKRSKFVKS